MLPNAGRLGTTKPINRRLSQGTQPQLRQLLCTGKGPSYQRSSQTEHTNENISQTSRDGGRVPHEDGTALAPSNGSIDGNAGTASEKSSAICIPDTPILPPPNSVPQASWKSILYLQGVATLDKIQPNCERKNAAVASNFRSSRRVSFESSPHSCSEAHECTRNREQGGATNSEGGWHSRFLTTSNPLKS